MLSLPENELNQESIVAASWFVRNWLSLLYLYYLIYRLVISVENDCFSKWITLVKGEYLSCVPTKFQHTPLWWLLKSYLTHLLQVWAKQSKAGGAAWFPLFNSFFTANTHCLIEVKKHICCFVLWPGHAWIPFSEKNACASPFTGISVKYLEGLTVYESSPASLRSPWRWWEWAPDEDT